MVYNRQPGQIRYLKAESLAVVATGPLGQLRAVAGVPVRFEMWGGAVASVTVERSGDDGASWQPLTAGGMVISTFTGTTSEFLDEETQEGALYRANVTSYSSGTLNVRLSQ